MAKKGKAVKEVPEREGYNEVADTFEAARRLYGKENPVYMIHDPSWEGRWGAANNHASYLRRQKHRYVTDDDRSAGLTFHVSRLGEDVYVWLGPESDQEENSDDSK